MPTWPNVVAQLQAGQDVELSPRGHSMTPIIRSGERVVISPIKKKLLVGDIVLAKVKGHFYLHKITRISERGFMISNNHGRDNGWTSRERIFGLVTKIGES